MVLKDGLGLGASILSSSFYVNSFFKKDFFICIRVRVHAPCVWVLAEASRGCWIFWSLELGVFVCCFM